MLHHTDYYALLIIVYTLLQLPSPFLLEYGKERKKLEGDRDVVRE